ncbi:hypothetical protein TRVA0_015S00408 [Trichomonascus vanleenenianus]|uniref:Rtc1p n=1 Tax=Trichomonascus vanleenenianus TaxID=2268995 RepID=UPI003ECA94EB
MKASGALARFGKAFYSSNVSGSSKESSSSVHSNGSSEHATPASVVKHTLKYEARSEIIAMGHSPERQRIAIAGKDFFQILGISPDEDSISMVQDMRDVRETRDFDKVFAVTALKWGHQWFNHYVALSTSGGKIFVYNINRPHNATKDFSDSNNRAINSLAYSMTAGHLLYSGSNDGSIKLWDLRGPSRKPSLAFYKSGDSAREVQSSPFNGNKFAVIYDSGIIQRWDLRNPLSYDRRMHAHAGVGLSIDWHPDYDYIVSGGRDQQIQIWNMEMDSRNPEAVIHAPSAVAKVRWQQLGSKNGVMGTYIASCGRSKSDYSVHIWDPLRPHVPVHVIEKHSNTITELYWKDEGTIWTASRDKTFYQHDLSQEPYQIDNLSARAFAWSPRNNLSFLVQEKFERDSRPVCFAHFAGFEPQIFQHFAENYAVIRHNGASSIDLCRHNASVAARARRFRTAQMWNVLQASLEWEEKRFQEYRLTKRRTSTSVGPRARTGAIVHTNGGLLKPAASKIAEGLRSILSGDATPLAEASTISTPVPTSVAASGYLPTDYLPKEVINDTESRNAAPTSTVDSAGSTVVQPNQTPTTSTKVKPLPIPEDRQPSKLGNELMSSESHSGSDELLSSFSTSASSPQRLYAKSPDSDGPAKHHGKSSYTRLPMIKNSMSSYSTSAGSTVTTTDDNGPTHGHYGLSYPSDGFSMPTNSSYNRTNSFSTEEGNIEPPIQPVGLGISMEHPTPEDREYREFLTTLTHPWRSTKLIEKAAERALVQGDVQLCAVLGTMFYEERPDAFPSTQAVEEWILSYIDLLKRCQLFAAAAEIIKGSKFEMVRELGLTETAIETLCHRCMAPLREVNTTSEFWYCERCKKYLDGCVICREPVKGLALTSLACGHKMHIACMTDWLFDDRNTECPSGCGTLIVR